MARRTNGSTPRTHTMLKVRCPSCGKSAAVPETDVGLLSVCLACGERYTVSDFTAPAEAPATQAPGADSFAPQPSARRRWREWVGWAAAALVLIATTVGLLLVFRARPDPITAATAA